MKVASKQSKVERIDDSKSFFVKVKSLAKSVTNHGNQRQRKLELIAVELLENKPDS